MLAEMWTNWKLVHGRWDARWCSRCREQHGAGFLKTFSVGLLWGPAISALAPGPKHLKAGSQRDSFTLMFRAA